MLVVTALNGCIDSADNHVDVYSTPIVNFNPKNVCQNITATFVDSSYTTDSNPINTWNWNFGDGTTSTVQNPVHLYPINGTYTVTLVASTAFCTGSDTFNIVVEPEPTALFTMSDSAGCAPLSVTFTNNSIVASVFAWDFGDGGTSTQSDPTHVFLNSDTTDTTYVVRLIASTAFGCSDTIIDSVTVFPVPVSSFTSNATPDCGPLSVSFTNTSVGASSYIWDFGDTTGSNLENPTHVYQNQSLFIEIYNTKLIAVNSRGCTDTSDLNVTVYPEPIFGFTTNPDSGCNPLSVTMPSVIGAVTYIWDFEDGTVATGPTPTHVFTNGTTNNVQYNVRLVATSSFGCSDTTFQTVIVHPNPQAIFSLSDSVNCQPFDVTITNSSTGASFFDWDFGDGDTSMSNATNISHLYPNLTNSSNFFDLQLIVESINGCFDTSSQQIEVYPFIEASYTQSDTAGCHILDVDFVDRSTNVQSYNWDFGDGNSDVVSSPSNSFQNTTTNDVVYNVRLILSSAQGCTDTAQSQVRVYPQPVASFTATPVTQKFPAATVTLNNTSNLGNWNYLWDFDNLDTSQTQNPGSYTYNTWGDFTISLYVFSDNCADTAIQNIVIEPPRAVPRFTASGEGCRPLTIDFENNSLYGVDYTWNFGDGGTSKQEFPAPYTYFTEGTFNISLTVVGPDGVPLTVTKFDSAIVHPEAIALFDIAPDEVIVPTQPINLYNLSRNASAYLWDFGDSTSSTEESPEHLYQEAGIYTITLYASNEWGCADTFTLQDAVFADSKGFVDFPNAFIPDPSGPNGGRYNRSSFRNDIFFPQYEGVIGYQLMIFNRWGELVFETTDVNVGWDGYHQITGELLQQDVYVWRSVIKFANQQETEVAGEVTLLR